MIDRKNNYAFIDSQNLNLGVKSQGWLLDFQRFRIFLKDKYQVEKAFLFIGYVVGNEGLYAALQKYGYICIFKPTLEIRDKDMRTVKGNVDADLVLHAMIEYSHYEKAVIVTGDGDFHCLVEYFANQDKLAKIIVPNRHFSSLLRRFSHFIANIQLFRNKLEKNKKRLQTGQNPNGTF
ncbi:MAG: NYN domain-containing protein [Candidatus Magasanikbacteria bacterium]|nr:NYN domain-containing protein [Candidatus Magasanikbacteria bacterium]